MRYLSVCSGIEAASVAWGPLGWEPVAFAEIEPFPSAVLSHHYPAVPNLGDMTRYREWPDYAVDLLCGGTPCFPGNTLIVARRGLVPISEIVVGDIVFTHAGNWRRVLATGSKIAPTVRLKGQGNSTGVVSTAGHPFYARSKVHRWVGREAGSRTSEMSPPEWVSAEGMLGLFWASPAAWPASSCPSVETAGRESSPPPMTDALAWVIGRWLGDGWTRINNRRGYVMICCGDHEAEDLAKRLHEAGLTFSRGQERTTTRFQIASRALARWLRIHFGAGAAGKTVPTWLFGWVHRRSLLEGYISADGCRTPNGWRISTVSRALALGTLLLAQSLGMSASRRLVSTGRTSLMIEERVVTERPFWQVSIYETARSSVELEGHRWGLVRKVDADGESEVFNLEVDGDNSYVADGFVVHNCQSFSVAGLRQGLADPRGNLAHTFLAIADRYRPRWIVWENVPGILSSNGGRDFGAFLGGLGELGYGWCYRVLDAQYVRVDGYDRAVPQRRNRVWVVGCLGDWRGAAAVLSEPESVLGHSPPRREAGAGAAVGALAGTSPGGGWRLGADEAAAGQLVAHTLRGEGFDASEDGTGRGIPLVRAVAFGGNDTRGPIEVATAVNAHGGPCGRLDFESETFVVPAVASALRARDGVKGVGGVAIDTLIPFDTTQITSAANRSAPRAGDPCHPLAARAHPPAIAFNGRQDPDVTGNRAGALNGMSPQDQCVLLRAGVRRLTPPECERLQGFPDGYTDVVFRGKPASDGPRYKAIGNSWPANVARWIGRRVELVEDVMRELERAAA